MKVFISIFFIILTFSFSNTTNKKITLQLSWFDQFQFAGYYMAKEKGFYEELGLDVEIKPFNFELKDIANSVSNDEINFAIDRETLILEKTKNKKIVALYALFQTSPLVLLSTKESQINELKDFKNKKIMTTIRDASEVSIKSMITSQNLNIKELNFIKHTHNINDLINKKTDVISAYLSKSPYHLQKMNIPYNVFAPKDYGFDMYSDLLYTSESMIRNDLDTVLKFKEASLRGWKYAYKNIKESVDLILDKYNTQNLTKEELIFEAIELEKLSYYNTKNLGEIKIDKLQRIYDLYNVMGLVENKINIKDFVYVENSFNVFMKKTLDNLYKYIELPYIYFFISIFFILICVLIYTQAKVYKMANELAIRNEELKDLSQTDHLTKIYNRRTFESISKEYLQLAKREKKDIAILLIDIDNFKSINDTFGHLCGDLTLISLAQLMTKAKRRSDIVARYGGEEFILLLPHTSIDGAKLYAQRLRRKIEKKPIQTKKTVLNITVSMGLTLIKEDEDLQTAIDRADEGLYISKGNGKNQVTVK